MVKLLLADGCDESRELKASVGICKAAFPMSLSYGMLCSASILIFIFPLLISLPSFIIFILQNLTVLGSNGWLPVWILGLIVPIISGILLCALGGLILYLMEHWLHHKTIVVSDSGPSYDEIHNDPFDFRVRYTALEYATEGGYDAIVELLKKDAI